jgi:hypothetical protein
MPSWFKPDTGKTPTPLEGRDKRVSLVVSLLAAALMLGGFGAVLSGSVAWGVPGHRASRLTTLFYQLPSGWAAMSLGILLLGLLPLMRVTLAAASYGHQRKWLDFLVAFIVLAELLLSMIWGG